MVVNYELTAADYREAAAHHELSPTRRKLYKRMQRRSVSGMLTTAAIMVSYFLLKELVPSMESPERAASPLSRAADVLLPLLAVCAIFVPVQAVAGGLRTRNWRAVASGALSLVFFAAAGALLYVGTARGARGASSQPLPAVLAPHLCWVVLTGAATVLTIRTQSMHTQIAWEGQQQLHLPFTLDASVAGLTLVTANGRHEYPWRGVTAFVETPNLFLVHVADLAFQIVPKRAFASDEERDGFRNMLRNLIPSAKPAFEVLPAGGGQASS